MTLYAAQVRIADDVVVGTWSGDDSKGLPAPPVETGAYIFELTQSEHEQLGTNPLFWGNDQDRPRWKIVALALTEQADTRRLVVFTPSTVVMVWANNVTTPVAVEVRQAAPNEHLVDTGINGDFNVKVEALGPAMASLWLRVTITNGTGEILIDREIIKEARISDQGVFRVDTPLQVRILAPNRF